MSADEGVSEPPIPASPSLECVGGEGAASEQGASFQMAVWSLLHDAPEGPPSDDDLLHDVPEEPPIEDEPHDCLPASILEEELERAWYSQAEDTEAKRASSTWDMVSSQEVELQSPPEPGGIRILPTPSKVVSSQLEASSEWRRAEFADGVSYKRRCLQAPKLPWEVGVWSQIFTSSSRDRGYSSLLPSIGVEDVRAPEESAPALETAEIPSAVRRRLRTFRLERPEDDRRDLALQKLRRIILYDPSTSELGKSVAAESQVLGDDSMLSKSFTCAFASKATGTLSKRAFSLARFSTWMLEVEKESPLRASEGQLFRYVLFLEQKFTGALSGQHFVEAVRFLDSIAHFTVMKVEAVLSSRVLGQARMMRSQKNFLKQRPPLKVKQLMALEQMMMECDSRWGCILGHLLFCAHVCARWSDVQRVRRVWVEVDESSGVHLIHAETAGIKNAITAEAKARLLPLVGLGMGVSGSPWAQAWMEARSVEGLQTGPSFITPTWCERLGRWGSEEMGSSEGTAYLREALILAGTEESEARECGTHSLKATLLTWTSQNILFSFNDVEQRALGHHLDAHAKSQVTYSRNYFIKLYGKVLSVTRAIQSGQYNPDMTAAASVAAIAGALEEAPAGGAVSPSERVHRSESESSSSVSAASTGGSSEAEGTERPIFRGASAADCVVHRLSGITHKKRTDDILACGRAVTGNFRPLRRRDIKDQPSCCIQCFKRTDGDA